MASYGVAQPTDSASRKFAGVLSDNSGTNEFVAIKGANRATQNAETVADMSVASTAEGATSDAAVITDTTGTLSGKLRGLVKWAFERMPASLGQKAKTASLPVTLASDEDLLSRVPASLGQKAKTAALAVTLASDEDLIARMPASLGQKAMTASLPVVIASDQGSLPIAQELWPSATTPVRKWMHAASVALSAAKVWPGPSGAVGIRLLDLLFSTDTALNLALHQSTIATYTTQVTTDSAAHLWQCDEASGNLADSIGANTLTAVGAATYQSASQVCADGKTVLLNGSSTGFAGSAPASCTTGAIEAWVNLTAAVAGNYDVYLCVADAVSGGDNLHCYIDTSMRPACFLKTGGANRFSAYATSFALVPGVWYHIVWQHDGTGLDLYVNGVSTPITYIAGNSSTAYWHDDLVGVADNLTLGFIRLNTDSYWFNGKVALAAWYGANQAASVWANHYALGAPVFGPHYFPADGGMAQPMRMPIPCEDAASLYATTSASANATLELTGYEE